MSKDKPKEYRYIVTCAICGHQMDVAQHVWHQSSAKAFCHIDSFEVCDCQSDG
jgi:hypothetical protein